MPDRKIGLHSVQDVNGSPVLGTTFQRAVDNGDGTYSPQVRTDAGKGFIVTGTPQTDANVDLLTGAVNGWFDALEFKSVSFQVVTLGSPLATGYVVIEQTNDIVNAPNGTPVAAMDTSSSWGLNTGTSVWVGVGVARVYQACLSSRYFRIRIRDAITGGAKIQVAAIFSRMTVGTQQAQQVQSLPSVIPYNNSLPNGTIVAAAGVNLTQLKASEGRIYKLDASNTTAAWQFIKIFNKPSASVVLGTTVPIHNLAIPPNSDKDFSLADIGIYYNGGISIAITAGAALLDNTPTTAGSVIANYVYC